MHRLKKKDTTHVKILQDEQKEEASCITMIQKENHTDDCAKVNLIHHKVVLDYKLNSVSNVQGYF